ncbi:ADP-ribosylation factor-like protein 6-interacting protein 4 [Watersipora subatra]|uniref:ADP-ribosylation factor-like protein 6-interacting protein 4 n=1 Tax=Watersipora subatra TaxID=2589382 RepID=UPI00355BD899
MSRERFSSKDKLEKKRKKSKDKYKDSSSSPERKRKKKDKKKLQKEKHKKKHKHQKKQNQLERDSEYSDVEKMTKKPFKHKEKPSGQAVVGPSISATSSTPAKGPITKEMWEKQQETVRRVYDPDTGRNRLVKGSGEIIEEIVSKEKQRQINKMATLGDGISYSRQTGTLR